MLSLWSPHVPFWGVALHQQWPPGAIPSGDHSFLLYGQRHHGICVFLLKGSLKETASTKEELTNDSSCSSLPFQQPGGCVALINQSAHAAALTQMAPAVVLCPVSASDKWHGVCWPVISVGQPEMDACVPLCDRGVNHNEEWTCRASSSSSQWAFTSSSERQRRGSALPRVPAVGFDSG